MEKVLERIEEITSDPYAYVARLKEESKKKIIGCFPMQVPEEIVHAAGLIPVVIWRGNEAVTWGHSHIPPYYCGIVRSFIDDAVKGKLDFMDGMIFHVRQCLLIMDIPLIIERHVKPEYMKLLYLPPIYPGKATKDFLISDLELFKKSLEDYTGNTITDDMLKSSIAVYNENRSLLEKLYEIRRKKPEILTGAEVMKIVWAGMLMQKEDHNELLKELIPKMEAGTAETTTTKIKVIPVGCLCQTPPFDILNMIEELGMVMPDDDLYVGSRYFANKVNMDGNPLEALAERHLIKSPVCPTKGVWDVLWADDVEEMVKLNNASGVISIHVKFCPPHACYYPDFKSKMIEKGIPEILVQVEHEMLSMEGIKTRLQSFTESLGGE